METERRHSRSVIEFLLVFGVTFGAAAVGAQYSPGPWYEELIRPPLVPPNWVFGPVWSALYTMMAVSALIVIRQREHPDRVRALGINAIQLFLNAVWSWLYFGEHRIGLALVDIVLLWLAILLTLVLFWRVKPIAGMLLIPYLAWVSFATYLNTGFFLLNR